MSYDNAGNLILDTYTGAGDRTYDAENRMTKAWANSQWQYYTYAADGRRVRRKVNNQETWQVYGLDGELLAEYPANGSASVPQKEYGYRNGQLLIVASSGGTSVSSATWSTLTNGIDLGGGSVRKTSPDSADWWDCTATAQQQIVGSGYFEATPVSAGKQAIGIFGNDGSERMIYIGVGSWVGIWEDGEGVSATSGYPTSPGIHQAGDRYRIEVEGSTVTYVRYRGGERSVMYVSTAVAPAQPLTLKLGMAYQNAEWQNAVISSGTSSSLNWLVSDHLSTPRMIIDKSGSLANVRRHDYLPFGEELFAMQGLRTTALGYSGGDGIRQQFTQKERDIETGLDYFLARYYSSTQGRFTSPDVFWKDSQTADPQSWNKYVYVRNNPLKYIDPEGEKATVIIETDEKNKKGKITVKATIALWTSKKSGVSKEDMQKAAQEYKKNIENAWSGTYEQQGIKYEVSTTVDIQVHDGVQAAMDSGAQNVLKVTEAGGHSGINPASIFGGPDTGELALDAGIRNSEAAHEFTHLLGVNNRESGSYLSNKYGAQRALTATAYDYGWAFGGAINEHRESSRPSSYCCPYPGLRITTRTGQHRSYTSTRELGAPYNLGYGSDWWR